MKRAFANTFERHEAVTLIESDCVRFRIGHDANATEPVTLVDGQSKDMPQQHTAYSAALHSSMDTESGKPQYRQRIAGKTASQSCGRKTVTLQARRSHGRETKNPAV